MVKDVGTLPVFQHDQPISMATDRDIIVRALAEGKNPAETPVGTNSRLDYLIAVPMMLRKLGSIVG